MREYMDKIFLSGLKLGTLSYNDKIQILKKITRGKVSQKSMSDTFSNEGDKKHIDEGHADDNNSEDPPPKVINLKSGIAPATRQLVNETNEFELTEFESSELESWIQHYRDATPRQIRILYYRYLLAKQLIRSTYFDHHNLPITYFIQLLVYYSDKELTLIQEELNKMLESDSEEYTVNIFDNSHAYNRLELISFYKILEMIIAY